jgi:hypothetical protein
MRRKEDNKKRREEDKRRPKKKTKTHINSLLTILLLHHDRFHNRMNRGIKEFGYFGSADPKEKYTLSASPTQTLINLHFVLTQPTSFAPI